MNTYKIFSDMDGVLVNFYQGAWNYLGGNFDVEVDKHYRDLFWGHVLEWGEDRTRRFWANLTWAPNGKELWQHISQFNASILSSPTKRDKIKDWVRLGKMDWIAKNLNPAPNIVILDNKKEYYAKPNYILIDDKSYMIERWIASGGIGIRYCAHTDPLEKVINSLNSIGRN